MAHNLTETSTFTATVQVPDDGDFVNESAFEPGYQALANRTKYLNDRHVARPGSSTDNAVVRWDGTGGTTVQNSVVTVSDAGAVAGVTSLAMGGALSGVTTLGMGGALSGATSVSMGGALSGATDVNLSGEVLYSTPKTRVFYIPAAQAGDSSNGAGTGIGWVRIAGVGGIPGYVAAIEASVTLVFDLSSVPQAMTITNLRLLVDPIGAGAITFKADRYSLSGTTWSSVQSTSTFSSVGSSLQWIDSGTISLAGANSTYREVLVTAAAASDQVRMLEVTYTDTGPKNPS